MSATKTEKMKLAPFRTVNDFVLDLSRYSLPTFNDLKRYNNRVVSNLLYYQTNYIAISVSIFTLFLLLRFGRMVSGTVSVAFVVAGILFTLNRLPQTANLKSKYPFGVYGVWGAILLILYAAMSAVVFISLVVLLPILFSLLHASTRSRNLKNKINNKLDKVAGSIYSNTPMEVLLKSIGIEAHEFDE